MEMMMMMVMMVTRMIVMVMVMVMMMMMMAMMHPVLPVGFLDADTGAKPMKLMVGTDLFFETRHHGRGQPAGQGDHKIISICV